MKKKTLRKLLKEQRKERAQAQTQELLLPAKFKERLVRMFLADPGRFAGNPRSLPGVSSGRAPKGGERDEQAERDAFNLSPLREDRFSRVQGNGIL